ncbi:MAG: hypothetical protein NTX64_04410 [Elusimicrobia bacterium]|nr:hypothetical protein [Elusimicrobiota bacterium]
MRPALALLAALASLAALPSGARAAAGIRAESCADFAGDRFGLHAIWDRTEETRDLGVHFVRGIYHFDGERQLRRWLGVFQNAGINTVLTVTPNGPRWGNAVIASLDLRRIPGRQGICGFPRDIDAYKAELEKLVEGIDGDGKGDYPELKCPIRHIQIGNEIFWQWYGDPPPALKTPRQVRDWRQRNLESAWRSYGELVRITYSVVKKASPEMTVILGDIFDDPDRGTSHQRKFLAEYSAYFDAVDIHFYGDYAELEDKLKKVDWLMRSGKPVWALEAGGPMSKEPFDSPEKLMRHAEEVVKLQVVLFAGGVEKSFWSSLIPTVGWPQPFLNAALLEGRERSYAKKPAYDAYKLLNLRINRFKSVVRIDPRERYYRFDFAGGRPVFILWSESGDKTADLSAAVSQAKVKVERFALEPGKSALNIIPETAPARAVRVSGSPVFVTPQ